MPRDYESTPVANQLGLPDIIEGLAGDLRELREGKISVNDAIARAHLAKQIFNGFRIYLNASKMLADNAKPTSAHLLAKENGHDAAAPMRGEG